MSAVIRSFLILFAFLVLAGSSYESRGTSILFEKTTTSIEVTEMCGGCVKNITKRFESVNDVDHVTCNIKTKTVTVFPKTGVTLSPKALWETMEEIGKTPVKLSGPSGTFTSKPSK